jgi:hypothetical protein
MHAVFSLFKASELQTLAGKVAEVFLKIEKCMKDEVRALPSTVRVHAKLSTTQIMCSWRGTCLQLTLPAPYLISVLCTGEQR